MGHALRRRHVDRIRLGWREPSAVRRDHARHDEAVAAREPVLRRSDVGTVGVHRDVPGAPRLLLRQRLSSLPVRGSGPTVSNR